MSMENSSHNRRLAEAKKVSLIIPVFNEEENIPFVIEAVLALKERLSRKGCLLEVIVTDNHSTDGSWSALREWAASNEEVTAFRLTRNYGFQASLVFGIRKASGDCVVILQSDLQDPPELIDEMVQLWLDGSRVVVARAVDRAEGIVMKSIRRAYYLLLQLTSDKPLMRGVQDFYLLDRSVYPDVTSGGYTHQFLRGHIVGLFGPDSVIDYDRAERKRGKTSFSLSSYYRIGMDGLLLHGSRLIRAGAMLSVFFAIMSIVALVLLVAFIAVGWRPAVAGWASVILLQLILFGVLGFVLAIVLEYLVRIYESAVAPVNPQVQDQTVRRPQEKPRV